MPDPRPWTVLESRVLLDRWPWLRVHALDVALPSGAVVRDFVRLESRDFASVFALTPDQRVVMVEQWRLGTGGLSLEIPAGSIDADREDPLACAQRELREETGYAAPEWVSLGSYTWDANRRLGQGHLFLARGAVRISEPQPETTEEDLVVHLVDLPTVRGWLLSGKFQIVAAVAAVGLALAWLDGDSR